MTTFSNRHFSPIRSTRRKITHISSDPPINESFVRLEESGLTFTFANHWQVLRYDQHPFYRFISGRGYRGVDFILVHKTELRAVWIEVKNYQIQYGEKAPKHFSKFVKDPQQLVDVLAEKYSGTLRGLRQINGYYRGKWWWGFVRPFYQYAHGQNRFASWLRMFDCIRFPLIHELSASSSTELVLVLATEESYTDVPEYRVGYLVTELERRTKALPKIWVVARAGAEKLVHFE